MTHMITNRRPHIEWLAVPVGPTGGTIQRYTLWARHVNHDRYQVALTYLLHPWPGEDIVRARIGNNMVQLVPISAQGKTRYVTASIEVARRWHQSMPDLIHSLNPISDLIAVVAKRILRSKVPIVSMTGGTKIATSPSRKFIYEKFHNWAKSDINLFLTVSAYDKHELVNQYGVPSHKVLVHRIGIDFSQFHVCEDGGPAHTFAFGFAGRFSIEKGISYLLEAVQLLRNRTKGKAFRLLLAGDGKLKSQIQHQVQVAGIADQVEFLGWVNDISQFLNRINVLVLPSLWEGTPRIILEAFYHSVPVIATDVGGVSEIVEHGKTGFLVPPRNTEALAEAMELALNDSTLLAGMGLAGRHYVEEHHGIEDSMSHIEHLYDRLLVNEQEKWPRC